MLGRKERDQLELFISGSLRQLIPDDHILVRVDRVLDLSWLRAEVEDCYCRDDGRPGIDPEVAVRLMLAGFLLGFVHDRRLMREGQVNVAIRWFVGYGFHERLPDHSSLTRIRQRWGAERFKAILARTVQACVKAGVAKGEVVHIDSTLIHANVSWDAIARKHAEDVVEANDTDRSDKKNDDPDASSSATGEEEASKGRAVCTSDPDATLTKNRRARRAEPAYKQHTAVDGECGVVLDVEVTTGAVHDTRKVDTQLDTIEATTGQAIKSATMDSAYAISGIYANLERRGIEAIVPAKEERRYHNGARIPLRRFKYDAKHDLVRCPRGRKLSRHGKPNSKNFVHYRAMKRDCRGCPLRAECLSAKSERRSVLISADYPALIRARRKRLAWGDHEQALYALHRGRVEGVHGEAKSCHGLGRAVRRGLENMQIQAYLTAAAINLKRLAALLLCLFAFLLRRIGSRMPSRTPFCPNRLLPAPVAT